MSSLKSSEGRIAYYFKRFPLKVDSLGIGRYDTADTKNLIGPWSRDTWKESLMGVSTLKVKKLLCVGALMGQRGYLTKAPIDDVRESASLERDASLEFEFTTTKDPIFRYVEGGHAT
jgi:hypothetical protein